MSRDEIMSIILAHNSFLLSHGVKRIGLFGSVARGEERQGSDVDIIVDFKEGCKSYDNFIELSFFLEDLLNCKVDLLTPESISPFMLPYIENDLQYETIH